MKLLKWGYRKRYGIKAVFEEFPHSTVFFRMINGFYFIYTVRWSDDDPVIERAHLEQMEQLINVELGTETHYYLRRSQQLK